MPFPHSTIENFRTKWKRQIAMGLNANATALPLAPNMKSTLVAGTTTTNWRHYIQPESIIPQLQTFYCAVNLNVGLDLRK
ncbi:unnamed protein product [Toxocara canis]|uniref:Uncharacterized protein n=1 Tax=Toxocara canis TaxID=6265 RepID=A0A183UDV4_TOXCA|nr:unnamed protein product [Toxocara canis]